MGSWGGSCAAACEAGAALMVAPVQRRWVSLVLTESRFVEGLSPRGEEGAGGKQGDKPVAGVDEEKGGRTAFVDALGELGSGEKSEPAEEADEGAMLPAGRTGPADEVEEDEGGEEVADKRSDHTEGEALFGIASFGHDAQGGHPGFGKEDGRI